MQHWLDNQLARQAEKPKNVNPVITSSEMNKKKEEVVYTCAAIMNRPKPKPKADTTPSGQQTPKEEPKKKEEEKMDVEEEGGATVEEMDVD